MLIPASDYICEYEVKKSKFIGIGQFFSQENRLKELVQEVRSAYSGCSHVVYAFSWGDKGDHYGYSDDKEPKGTAGKPVYEVIRGKSLTYCLFMVVRYFGGTKLGKGGLVRAYTKTAGMIVEGLSLTPLVYKVAFQIEFPYEIYETGKRVINRNNGVISHEEFSTSVLVQGVIPVEMKAVFMKDLKEISQGTIVPVFGKGGII